MTDQALAELCREMTAELRNEDYFERCPVCDGTGTHNEDVCPDCEGAGWSEI